MSAIMALSMAHYTSMKNNALYNMLSVNNARMGLISNPYHPAFGSLEALSAMDTQLELESITNSIQYQIAKAMLEQLKKQQKEETINRFNAFA